MSDLKNIYLKKLQYHLPILKGGGGINNLPRKKKKENFCKMKKNDEEHWQNDTSWSTEYNTMYKVSSMHIKKMLCSTANSISALVILI